MVGASFTTRPLARARQINLRRPAKMTVQTRVGRAIPSCITKIRRFTGVFRVRRKTQADQQNPVRYARLLVYIRAAVIAVVGNYLVNAAQGQGRRITCEYPHPPRWDRAQALAMTGQWLGIAG